jgi:very-short-patch-repair endonuclease
VREIEKKAMARRFRKKLTPAEVLMWWRLRRDYGEWRFRRQHPIGPYIADFACVEGRLVVEIDGATHGTAEERAHDDRRTRYLEAEGWRVLRFWNEEIVKNRDGVRETIIAALQEQMERLRVRSQV